MAFFFHLGRERELCRAELSAMLPSTTRSSGTGQGGIDLSFPHPDIAMTDAVGKDEALALQEACAGVISVSESLPRPVSATGTGSDDLLPDENAVITALNGILPALAEKVPGKFHFGMSWYGTPEGGRKGAERIGLSAKKALKDLGHSVRYVASNEPTLSSVILSNEKLLPPGFAGNCIKASMPRTGGSATGTGARGWILTRTISTQDWREWQDLDMERPVRDRKNGILPFKLAQMMVNLAGKPKDGAALWDPFCGNGTVLLGAARAGYGTVIGSDIAPQAVDSAEAVWEWYRDRSGTGAHAHFAVAAAERAANNGLPRATVIVTEPYLGPNLLSSMADRDILRIRDEMSALYAASVANFHKLLPPGGIVVMALPGWVATEDRVVECRVEDIFPSAQWEATLPADLWHFHPKHLVRRNIVGFRKK